jgi:hypothetical protein
MSEQLIVGRVARPMSTITVDVPEGTTPAQVEDWTGRIETSVRHWHALERTLSYRRGEVPDPLDGHLALSQEPRRMPEHPGAQRVNITAPEDNQGDVLILAGPGASPDTLRLSPGEHSGWITVAGNLHSMRFAAEHDGDSMDFTVTAMA